MDAERQSSMPEMYLVLVAMVQVAEKAIVCLTALLAREAVRYLRDDHITEINALC